MSLVSSAHPDISDDSAAGGPAGSVDRAPGLSSGEAAQRLATVGPNELTAGESVPAWRRLLSAFSDRLILMLVAAAVVALVVSGELKTPLVVLGVVLLNVIIGFLQEQRAERSVEALRKSMTSRARVRRDGELRYIDARELVPGDIVLVEAGDRVPADGRLLTATNLEATEAALTGESQPSTKVAGGATGDDVPVGDRSGMVFMNTTVTRGRAVFEVTSTGMATQMGRLATLLRETESAETPLQKQLAKLAHSVAKLAIVIVAIVFVIGLIRGESVTKVALTAVARAVAAIPEGLPAVTVVTLALGVSKMAKRNAIVKRLASVETLGCATVICSDKTGTLTLNEMTAVEIVSHLMPHEVTGSGYSPDGEIRHRGDEPVSLDTALISMALCNDAEIRQSNGQWELVGDPTEGALAVLAQKGGIGITAMRSRHPRIAEVPFDSAHKFMATVHELPTAGGAATVRVIVKGAPDVLLARSTHVIDADGVAAPIASHRSAIDGHNSRLGDEGKRVLAVAHRELSPEVWDEFTTSGGDPMELVGDLTLLALIGIVDPPRSEARDAISSAHSAGIAVKMITGDH
ncbi:MAG: cation-translocating P-type ATPase, partial [Ilumatobacteraceae bacterium]